MSPFQRARDEANAIRIKLIGERADSAVHAADLLGCIETVLNLGIEPVPEGASELGNGDACLHRNERYIYVRKGVEPEHHAELVAHELGHWELDAAKTPITVASLSSIAAPDGSPAVAKVEAYGARERQELQANVFARELLLPRHVARTLFAGGTGARKVARDLGIPLKVVRQQMLDAILLPMAASPPGKTLHPPSDDQGKAAQAPERFVNVVAGPGTGKTTTLIHRIRYLVGELKVDPSHILVLTFTNKAAFELVDRLRSAGIARAADIWAGTFHAFGLEFLRKYHDAFGLGSDIVVADKLNAITMLARELPRLELQYYLRVEDPYEWLGGLVQGITRLKEELVTPAMYRSRIAQLVEKDDEVVRQRNDLATLYEAYERLLREAGLVDFVDLISIPATSIRTDRPRYSEIADKFQYVLVDEYQDVTEAMVHLVKQLAQKAKSLWVVGDVRQAIHHWRGASVKSLIIFEQTFKEQADSTKSTIRKYPLELNRRSSQEIVDLVTCCGETHVLQPKLALDRTTSSMGATGQKPILLSCAAASDIPDGISAAVKHYQQNGIPYGQQAILCRKTASVEHLAQELHLRKIPLLYIGELAHRPEIKQFLCLMQLLTERQPRALVGLVLSPNRRMPKADTDLLLHLASGNVEFQRGRWLAKAKLSAIGQEIADEISKLVYGYNRYSPPWDFLCDLLLEHRFGLPPLEDTSIDAHVKRIAIWQFFHSVLAGDGESKRRTLSRFLLRLQLRQKINETYSDRELPPEAAALDAVRLQTVHGSKGLEYEAVHIGYVEKESYGPAKPWTPDDDIGTLVPPEVLGSNAKDFELEQAVERNNLFYVAVSRAKQRLVMYEDQKWANRNRPPQLSAQPQVYALKSFSTQAASTAPQAPSRSPAVLERALTYAEFETYARCPLQYCYRYGMQLGREQEVDSSVRAQMAVMTAIKQLASGKSAEPLSALEFAWLEYRLPSKLEDKTLWDHAHMVYRRGTDWLQESGGRYHEPQTEVGSLPICFPWMIARTENRYELLRFSARGAQGVVSLLRPMLSGLSGDRIVRVTSLLSARVHEAKPSGDLSSTNALAAAKRFLAGDRSARRGRHCKFCAFLTICPSYPA